MKRFVVRTANAVYVSLGNVRGLSKRPVVLWLHTHLSAFVGEHCELLPRRERKLYDMTACLHRLGIVRRG